MRQLIWGGNIEHLPQNWRREIVQTLRSLLRVRASVIVLGGNGWTPKFGMESVAVAMVEDLRTTRPEDDQCNERCIAFGSGTPHHHFGIQIGAGFLGVLEKLARQGDAVGLTYDFNSDSLKKVRARTTSISTSVNLLGPAAWCPETTAATRRILNAFTGEITRQSGKSKRTDKAKLFLGSAVPGKSEKDSISCPLLDATQKYVLFGGNGKRPGQGYLLVGKKNTGWLYKCGFAANDYQRFLHELDSIPSEFGIVLTGFCSANETWYSLPDMRHLAEVDTTDIVAGRILLRPFAPEDYLARIGRYFREKGEFAVPISGALAGDPGIELQLQVKRSGLSQDHVAQELGVSRPHLSNIFRGRRSWPPGLQDQLQELLHRFAEQELTRVV